MMNKKANTLFFVLGATVLNIVIMLVIFVALFVLFGALLAPRLPQTAVSIVLLLLFIASIVLTYFVYHKLVLLLSKKVDMEKYFDPIFGKRRRP